MTASPESQDQDLVAAVLRRDRKASAEFVERYADPLYSYVRHRLLPRADLVEDLVQDVFLSAWENLTSFRGESSLRTWLLGIARNRVADHYRVRLRDQWPLDSELQEMPDLLAESRFIEGLDRDRLDLETRRILGELPEVYSIALLWRYWENHSTRQMADETGRTEKSIERLLARARALFRKRWSI